MSAIAPPVVTREEQEPSRLPERFGAAGRVVPVSVGTFAVVAAVVAFVGYHWWQAAAGPPIVWNDSLDYARSAIWAGTRPPLVPAVLALTPTFGWFVAVQTAVAVVAWVALAAAVAARVPPSSRPGAVATVLAFGCTTAVVRWERSVLSESLATSTLVLLVAALLWATPRLTWPRVAALTASAALFAAVRDSDVWIVWLLALAIAVDAITARRGVRGVVAALALATCAGLLLGGARAADRSQTNVEHVYFVRVFPYPDRVAWFESHGMPDADVVRAYAAGTLTSGGAAPVVGLDPGDDRVSELAAWLREDGTATYLRWVLEHPGYVLTEPARRPERAYNFADGDLDGYSGPERTELALLDATLSPPAWIVLVAAAAAAAVLVARRRDRRTSGARVAVLVGGLGLVHMLLAWHGDGMETTRHAVIGNVQARLGALVLVVLAAAELWARRAHIVIVSPPTAD